mgnify:CR=1 FL=1
MTGVIDVMLVDVQCVFPATTEYQKCFHTKVISTSPKAKVPGSTHIDFHEEEAMETAKKIIRVAIDNFGNREQRRPIIIGSVITGFRNCHHSFF